MNTSQFSYPLGQLEITVAKDSPFHSLIEETGNGQSSSQLRLYLLVSILKDFGVVPTKTEFEVNCRYNVATKCYHLSYEYQ